MANHKNTERELMVFRKFAANTGVQIISDTIEHRSPPEPDILCTSENGESIAFELTEIIDQDFARGVSKAGVISDFYTYLKEKKDREKKDKFITKYKNTMIHFKFNENAGNNRIRGSISDVIDFLLSNSLIPQDISINKKEKISRILDAIWISEINIDGPIFCTGHTDGMDFPLRKRIQSKFSKSYKSTASDIELLLYMYSDPERPGYGWSHELDQYLQDNLGQSPFRSIWVYYYQSNTIPYVFLSNMR